MGDGCIGNNGALRACIISIPIFQLGFTFANTLLQFVKTLNLELAEYDVPLHIYNMEYFTRREVGSFSR